MRVFGRRISLFLMCGVLLAASVSVTFYSRSASAAQITVRKLTLENGTITGLGGSTPGTVQADSVNHFFSFTIPDTGNANIGSILLEYCTTASGTCTMPTGLFTNNAGGGSPPGTTTLNDQTNLGTAFTLNTSTNGAPYLTRTADNTIGTNAAVSFRLRNVTNPSTTNSTFFVRIATKTSTDGTGAAIDSGVVAASTATPIVLTGYMPEYLQFCTGDTVTVNCGSAGPGSISFNQEFSPTATRTATSQFAAATNANAGYAITVRGPTLTSGSNTIPAIGATAAASTVTTGQFGLNLVDNTTPNIGANVNPASSNPDLQALPTTHFNNDDAYAFVAGSDNIIANSDFDGSSGPTNSQVYTASYIVNVTGVQPPGTYTTTLSYVCTATF